MPLARGPIPLPVCERCFRRVKASCFLLLRKLRERGLSVRIVAAADRAVSFPTGSVSQLLHPRRLVRRRAVHVIDDGHASAVGCHSVAPTSVADRVSRHGGPRGGGCVEDASLVRV